MDFDSEHLYWTEPALGVVKRMKLDGKLKVENAIDTGLIVSKTEHFKCQNLFYFDRSISV